MGAPVAVGTMDEVVDEDALDVPEEEAAEVVVAVEVAVVVAEDVDDVVDDVLEEVVVVVVVPWRAAKWFKSTAETMDTATRAKAMTLLNISI